jgi:hypothetical protein
MARTRRKKHRTHVEVVAGQAGTKAVNPKPYNPSSKSYTSPEPCSAQNPKPETLNPRS